MSLRTCIHIRTNGSQSGSPAMRGDLRCYYHYRQRKPLRRLINLNDLSTPNARQEALSIVFGSLAKGVVDLDAAEKMLQAVKLSMKVK